MDLPVVRRDIEGFMGDFGREEGNKDWVPYRNGRCCTGFIVMFTKTHTLGMVCVYNKKLV